MHIRPLKFESDDLDSLLQKSTAEGFKQVQRFINDWESGENRFDQHGECIFVAILDNTIVGLCGLNDNGNDLGRLRRLYIHPNYRGRGLGKMLSQTCIDIGLQTFQNIVVNAGGEVAVAFYENLGWYQLESAELTHALLPTE